MTIQYIFQSCGEVDCVATIVTVSWDPSQQQWLPDSNDIALAGYRCLECDSWEVEEIIEGGSMNITHCTMDTSLRVAPPA